MNLGQEYPQEFFLKLDDPHRIGRLTVNKIQASKRIEFLVEIDIVFAESKKIWGHVVTLYHFEDQQEAIDAGVQKLSQYLSSQKNQFE